MFSQNICVKEAMGCCVMAPYPASKRRTQVLATNTNSSSKQLTLMDNTSSCNLPDSQLQVILLEISARHPTTSIKVEGLKIVNEI